MNKLAQVLTALVFSGWAGAASATLLTVDVSDASFVEITATSESSSISFSELLGFGFSLDDFFTANTPSSAGVATSSTLTNVLDGLLFNTARTGPNALNDLNISGTGGGSYAMNTSGAAFSGMMTVDLSAYAGILKGVGASGNIFYDYAPFDGESFGEWEIVDGTAVPVPVPATLALFGLGLAGLGWSRRKKA